MEDEIVEEELVHTVDIVGCQTDSQAIAVLLNVVASYGSINAKDNNGKTVLHHAVCSSKVWLVETVLNYGDVDVNAEDNGGNTALIYASQDGDLRIVEILARYGADVEIYDHNQDSALLWAAYNNHQFVVAFLVEDMKADVDHIYQDGRNAIMWAARKGNIDIVRYLYYLTDTINAVDKQGRNIEGLANLSANTNIQIFIRESQNNQLFVTWLFYNMYRSHNLFEKETIRLIRRFLYYVEDDPYQEE